MRNEGKSCEDILRKLISFDTTSRRSNLPCIDYIRDYLDDLGTQSELVLNEDGTKACLWATIGRSDRPGITLAGHIDTVPVDGQAWTSDPFQVTEREDRFFGRGTADMKGFIACALAQIPEFLASTKDACFHLAITYDEEITMAGALRLTEFLLKNEIKPHWVWLGEPTGLSIVDQHKGVSAYKSSFVGVPGHSGLPQNGLNAIALANHFMNVISDVALDKAQKPYANSRFDPPYSVFNFGIIEGGTAENIIAGACELLWQIRAYPGEKAADLCALIDKRARDLLAPRLQAFAPQASVRTCTCFDIPPFLASPSNKGAATLKHFQKCEQTYAVGFGTEAGIFQKLGTDAIICGPGFIEQAHQPDEYVDKKQLFACVDLMRAVLLSSSAQSLGPSSNSGDHTSRRIP